MSLTGAGQEAVTWYRKAAELGYAKAMVNLGIMYAGGLGVIEDDVEAYAWVNVAAAKGEKKAALLMSIWSSRMLFACIALMPAQENAQTLFGGRPAVKMASLGRGWSPAGDKMGNLR